MSSREGKIDGFTFVWFDRHPNERVAECDKCHKRVWPAEPRLQVHDRKGKFNNKGTLSSYWCRQCAGRRGLQAPIPEKYGKQEGLFD